MQAMVEQEASDIIAESFVVKEKEVTNVPESPKTLEAQPTILKAEIKPIEIISVEVYNSSVQELENSGQAYEVIFQNEVPMEQPLDNFDFIGMTVKDDKKPKKDRTKPKDTETEVKSEAICDEVPESIVAQDDCNFDDNFSDGEMSAHEESQDESKYCYFTFIIMFILYLFLLFLVTWTILEKFLQPATNVQFVNVLLIRVSSDIILDI